MSQLILKENGAQTTTNIGYWPGHVMAESLLDEPKESNPNKSSSPETGTTSTGNESHDKKSLAPLKPGGSFSAIINSMLPINILCDKSPADSEYVYDEFGFRVEKEPPKTNETSSESNEFVNVQLSPPKRTAPRSGQPFLEDSKHKLKWIAYLEFNLNADLGSSFSWNQVTSLKKCEKLRSMIRGQGIPHSLRPFIWMRLTGALQKKQNSKFKYVDLFKNIEHDQYHTSKQIEKDLLRTLPTNACFACSNSVGVSRLRRILQGLAWLYPSIGYCQGMGTVVASLLLFLEEEDAFWMMSSIIEDILPSSYYSHTLLGVQADMKVLRQLIATYLPQIDEKFKQTDIEISLVCINWYLTVFSNVFHMKILLRVWDLFFYEGSPALFQITLALLKLNEAAILAAEGSTQIFAILSDSPADIHDVDALIETSIRVASSVNPSILDSSRRKHQAYLMAQNGSIINPSNYQHLPMIKERARSTTGEASRRSKNLLKMFKKSFKNGLGEEENKQKNQPVKSLTNDDEINDENDPDDDELNDVKMKNIIQTELLVNFREVIVKIAHHFQQKDKEKYAETTLNADYSIESHNRDYEMYIDTSKVKRFKRAKAVLDFEKSDEDELGFKKNDIITILSTKDDHCWIGELNGEKGWFPSRFVSMVDERNGKIYSPAGDDSVDEKIRDLVRGELSPALKAIFEHGLKKWTVLGGAIHPWTFIEEAAQKVVEENFDSVYSRLVLCRTYRLDEDGKVLSPDELLYRSVKLINMSHNTFRANMDVKFRSLICVALNEQVLHIWLETLCSSLETVKKWYHEWSFLRSPGWVQIKCELRLLAQYSFFLNPDAELPEQKKDIAIDECIKDMLVKHHLFSWEI